MVTPEKKAQNYGLLFVLAAKGDNSGIGIHLTKQWLYFVIADVRNKWYVTKKHVELQK